MASAADTAAAAADPVLLQAHDLECERGGRPLFRGLAVELRAGECLYVAGDNGAGKTSLLRILAGLLQPLAGSVRWRGREIARAREEFGAELAYVGHLNGIKDELTAQENVRLWAAVRGAAPDSATVRAALRQMSLEDYADAEARRLSQGQKRRLALARLCLSPPAALWILDEPYNALDAASVGALRALVDARLAAGGIVVLTAHQPVEMPRGARRLALGAGAGA